MITHTDDCDDPTTCTQFDCDVCTRSVPRCHIGKVQAYGIETYACDACRGESTDLTTSQQAWVRAKAQWERMSESAVRRSYDIPIPQHLNEDGTAKRCADCSDDRSCATARQGGS